VFLFVKNENLMVSR